MKKHYDIYKTRFSKASFSELKNETLKNVTIIKDEECVPDQIIFELENGSKYLMFHEYDAGESVTIEDICGNIENIINVPLIMVDESSDCKNIDDKDPNFHEDSCSLTWTFYKLGTVKGYVTIRWYGCSNGCYSEKAVFKKIEE